MQISERTSYATYRAIAPYISEDDKKRVAEAAVRKYGDYYALTFDTFFGILSGDYNILGDVSQNTAFQVLWVKGFADFLDEFTNKVERLSVKPTPKQARAHEGTFAFDFRASVLVFLRSYFGLHSFTDAGRLTIGEYLTAKQDVYNTQIVQRNYERMRNEELSKKKHK